MTKKVKLFCLIFTCFWVYLHAQESEGPKKDEKKPERAFTGNLTLISDYRSRGISQTMRQPAIQGEFRYDHSSGLYAKTWVSNVDGTGNFINNASSEWDFYLGYRWKIPKSAFEIDAGLEFFWYPGGEVLVSHRNSYNSAEYYIQMTYRKFNCVFHQTLTDFFGINSNNPPMNWATNRAVSPNGHSIGSIYFEFNWEIPVYKKTALTLHGGYQNVAHYPQLSYFDWLIMLTYEFDWFEANLACVGTNAKRDFYNVPNHTYHSHKRIHLGTPGINLGVTRKF